MAESKLKEQGILKPEYYCELTLTGNQSIGDAAWVKVIWNSETHDADSMHDNSTNPTRITIQEDGIYLVNFKTDKNHLVKKIIKL